ncbi:MAG: CaiB/BaiF CoA-transferase family protein [Phenylobacterium sp.]|uniref:CaiB/BaiF CoA transferase family protein n=1 Tax=Phenylobacterium sp. TaxID=1871053 RepID=UPI0027370E17|nr:CaiB/BaiF CoA-transferase family protein [Phenylobacterium sp.]MDP3748382.1 CaiB/BaiF CoA-transferase family protein [Phenylobacterium sp.]
MLLEGLKVVEMATWVAGPGCAGIMADWGAEVIKVESPDGDATRAFYPDTAESPGNPIFSMENRGKKGVVLDIAKPEGRRALIALLRQADVFITNVRPGSLKRMGLDYESLKGELPQLIYAAVTGYGLTGPEADVPAFDITAFWTRSGVARAMIPPDQEPFPSRPGFGDHTTALATLSAVLAAAHERTATGRGRLVETSLIRAGAYAISWDLSLQLRYGQVVTAQPRDERPVAISGFFRTGDDRWVCIVPRTLDCFTNMMIAIDRPEILADERYDLPIEDLAIVREVRAMIDEAFGGMTLAEASERLTAGDLAWAPMATLAELAESDMAREAGCFETVADGWGGSFRAPAAPARFPEGAPPVGRPAPKLGEHTREVLEAAGLRPDEIEALL